MALPFLPSEHIRLSFDSLLEGALRSGNVLLARFMDYMQATWFSSTVWRPENWSVFQQTVHTNNDVEGWHARFNKRVGRVRPSIYILIHQLYKEAMTVDLQIQLVSEMALSRYRRRVYRSAHARLFSLWEEYEEGLLHTSDLLTEVSYIVGFAPVQSEETELNIEVH